MNAAAELNAAARVRRWRSTAVYTRGASAYLAEHCLCRPCLAAGRRRAADQVDHVRPARSLRDFSEFLDQRNWQPICTGCHSEKSQAERGRPGRAAIVPYPVAPPDLPIGEPA